MNLINADYLTGRIFTEADLTNAHTCYDSIMAIIKSMESEDVLGKIRAEITNISITDGDGHNNNWYREPQAIINDVLQIIDKYKAESEG